MSRKRKNLAHRPSQSHLEFVKNSHGETVRNTAYDGDSKKTHSGTHGDLKELKSESTYEDNNASILAALQKPLSRSELEDIAQDALDNVSYVSEKINNDERLTQDDIHSMSLMYDIIIASEKAHIGEKNPHLVDNVSQIHKIWAEDHYVIDSDFTEKINNTGTDMDISETSINIYNPSDTDFPTQMTYMKNYVNEEKPTIVIRFGYREPPGIVKYVRDEDQEVITVRDKNYNDKVKKRKIRQ